MSDPLTPEDSKQVPSEEQPQRALSVAGGARTIGSEELFAGQRVVLIQHAGEEYRLMITRNDRLILQK